MRRNLGRWAFVWALATPTAAWAQPTGADADEEETVRPPRLGLELGEPGVRSAPPATPFGVSPATSKDNVLDFHGYLLLPLNLGLVQREDPAPGQSGTVFHTPPLVPQSYRRFQYTAAIPTPWLQLNFTYGNSTIAGTLILAATAATEAEAYYDPVRQLGVNGAFVTLNVSDKVGFPLQIRGGAIQHRYGAMGAFDAGRYATPLIARINSIGQAVTATFKVGSAVFVFEEGVGGQLGRTPTGFPSQGWNDFADPNVGSSYVAHLHGGVSLAQHVQLGLHYARAFSRDDQNVSGLLQKGHIQVLGADARLIWGRFGHLYLGFAHTGTSNAGVVSGVIEILNARGGPGLVGEYLGPLSGGNGGLTTFGAQYDLSVARSMFGDKFRGQNPDLLISLFGIGTKVASDDPAYDGILKLKGGAEATYTLASWFALGGRVDHVRQDNELNRRAFTIYTARLLFHTGWRSRDQFALQYSRFVYGREVYVETGYPPTINPASSRDQDVVSLSATFWW